MGNWSPSGGLTLRAVLQQRGALRPEVALTITKGCLRGLAPVHVGGIVHQAYRPENIVVGYDGESSLSDFDSAMHGGDTAADVYAATVVLFEMLTGRPPAENAPIAVDQVPRPLHDLITRGTARDLTRRPGNAAELLNDLDQAARAGYGPDWEERGRAAIVAGLSAPLPAPAEPPPPEPPPTLLPPEPSAEAEDRTAGAPGASGVEPTPKWFYAAMAGIAGLAIALTALVSMPTEVPDQEPMAAPDAADQTPDAGKKPTGKASSKPAEPKRNPYRGKKTTGVLRPGSNPKEFRFATARKKAGTVLRTGDWIPVRLPSELKIEEEVSGSRKEVDLLEFRMFISRIRENGKELTGVNAPMKVRFAKKGILKHVYIAGGR